MKKAICIIKSDANLTYGGSYEVISVDNSNRYLIVCDDGMHEWITSEHFKDIPEYRHNQINQVIKSDI